MDLPTWIERLFLRVTGSALPQRWGTLRETWQWWAPQYLPQLVGQQSFAGQVETYVLPVLGDLYPSELVPGRVDALLRSHEHHLAPRTLNALRSNLRRVLRDAQANGRWPTGSNPCDLVKLRAVPRQSWPTLTLEEALQLLQDAPEPRRAIYALGIYLGLRPGEVVALRRIDVDLETGTLHVHRSHERNVTKNGRSRTLPIPRELEAYLEPLELTRMLPDDLLFPSPRGGLRRRDEKRGLTLKKDLRAAGIDKPLRAYDLRHTFATLARNAGVHQEVRRLTLGHVEYDVTGMYEQWTPEQWRKELEKLRLLPKAKRNPKSSPTRRRPRRPT